MYVYDVLIINVTSFFTASQQGKPPVAQASEGQTPTESAPGSTTPVAQQNGDVSTNGAATEKAAVETATTPMDTGDQAKPTEEVKQEEVGSVASGKI